MACPTCAAIAAILNATGRIPAPIVQGVAYSPPIHALDAGLKTAVKKRVSGYNRRYASAFRKLKKQHTLASGKYGKGWNFKKLVKAAHKVAKR